MSDTRPGLIVSAGVGLVALIGLAVKLLGPGAGPLEERVDRKIAMLQEATPQARHRDVDKTVEELNTLASDPGITRLPASTQEKLTARLSELQAYQDYVSKLKKIENPLEAKVEDQLAAIRDGLNQLKVPDKYTTEWAHAEAVQQHDEMLKDVDSIQAAVRKTCENYQAVTSEGNKVLSTAAESDLIGRVKAVLDKASKLPSPRKDDHGLIPNSRGVTYTVVFQFDSVRKALDDWTKVRDNLEPLTRTVPTKKGAAP